MLLHHSIPLLMNALLAASSDGMQVSAPGTRLDLRIVMNLVSRRLAGFSFRQHVNFFPVVSHALRTNKMGIRIVTWSRDGKQPAAIHGRLCHRQLVLAGLVAMSTPCPALSTGFRAVSCAAMCSRRSSSYESQSHAGEGGCVTA